MIWWSHLGGLKTSSKAFFTEYWQCCVFDYTNRQSQDLVWRGYLNFTYGHFGYTSLLWHVVCTDLYLACVDVFEQDELYLLPCRKNSRAHTNGICCDLMWLFYVMVCVRQLIYHVNIHRINNISMLFGLPITIWSNPLYLCILSAIEKRYNLPHPSNI
jgi:hypothetical protein